MHFVINCCILRSVGNLANCNLTRLTMKTNPLSTSEFRELQREIYLEKLSNCKTVEDAVLALLDAHLEACAIALASDETDAPAPAPKPAPALETQFLLGFEGLDAEQYAFIYGASEAIENALDAERSDLAQSDEYMIPERYQDFVTWNSSLEREFRWAMMDIESIIEGLDELNYDVVTKDCKSLNDKLAYLHKIREISYADWNYFANIVKAFYEDRARREKARKAIDALPHPDAVADSEKISRFNLKPEMKKKLAKHNISLQARLRSSSDQRDQLPYLVSLFDSVWSYDVYLSQQLERYPAKIAFVIESSEDEEIAHALACLHARALESYTDKKFNRFLAKRGRKPLPPRKPRKPAPAPSPKPAPKAKKAQNPNQLRLF